MIRKAEELKAKMNSHGGFIIATGSSAAVIYDNGRSESIAMNAFRAVNRSGFLTSYIYEYNATNREIRYAKKA